MRKGADSSRRLADGHASRGVRHPRRRDAVWLVTTPASNQILSGQPHHTAGALALDHTDSERTSIMEARRCALIVERDPALAEALTRSLQDQFEPAWSVRRVSDSRLHTPSPQRGVPEIIVLNANWPAENGAESYQRLSAIPDLTDAQLIFITSDTSYQLSQRGVMNGVVLREWRHPKDIVTLIAEALGDSETSA